MVTMTILTVTISLSTHQGYDGDYDNSHCDYLPLYSPGVWWWLWQFSLWLTPSLLTRGMVVTMTILTVTNSLSTHQGYDGDYDNSHCD